MKMIKNILVGMVVVGVMVVLTQKMNDDYKEAMNICRNAGNSVQYCESKLG